MVRKCVICQKRRPTPGSNFFLAKLPLDPDRCRLWLKAIGQVDLVHIPIEKLNELKYVCEQHFRKHDFNKSRTKLKKDAMPTLQLTEPPLRDEVFSDFPLHIGQYPKSVHEASTRMDHAVTNDKLDAMTASEPPDFRLASGKKEEILSIPKKLKTEEDSKLNRHKNGADLEVISDCEPTVLEDDQYEILDDDIALRPWTPDCMSSISFESSEAEDQVHHGYRCDGCQGPIIGWRYSCLQCVDVDLCATCESNRQHPGHLVLRLPSTRCTSTYGIQSCLSALRRSLAAAVSAKQFDEPATQEITVKDEIKDEQDPLAICTPLPMNLENPLTNVTEIRTDNNPIGGKERVIITAAAERKVVRRTPVITEKGVGRMKNDFKLYQDKLTKYMQKHKIKRILAPEDVNISDAVIRVLQIEEKFINGYSKGLIQSPVLYNRQKLKRT